MSEETRSEHQTHDKCGYCHGLGHTECTSCHGAGEETCSTCHGKKDVECSNCHGHGHYSNCNKCGSTGRVDCKRCGGSGQIRERCGNCHGIGKIVKERYRNCGKCHGEGVIHQPCWRWDQKTQTEIHYDKPKSCDNCNGTGQVKEKYYETCPTCGGEGRKSYTVNCPDCHGRGDFRCNRCHGTGKAECEKCSGTGKLTCSTCSGSGKVACHDCHGGGNHVCVHCYGTGATPPQVAPVKSGGMNKVNEAIDLLKKKEFIRAFELFREAAINHNNAAALRRLGRMYERGNAIYQNQKRANILYRIAANAGDIKALYFLGLNYVQGLGVDKNRSEARRLLELATVKGCSDAEKEYIKVADAKLVLKAISGVVGWQKSFEVPKFLLEADPSADQKDKDAKEAARKAEEERKERERKRKIRNINLCRGLWWLLFRVSAATVYFACLKDCYKDIPENDLTMLVAGFFLASYLIRPKFGGVWYFFVALLVPIVAVVHNSTNPMASFCLFTVMVTFFMRWMGEKLKLPMITYPLLGAMVGFCSSPFAISHNVFNVAPWWFSTMGLAILFFLANLGMSGNNGTGVVAKGERKTSWVGTLVLLGICALVTAYIATTASGDVYKFRWNPNVENTNDKTVDLKVVEKKMTDCERGICYRDGKGVTRDIAQAKACFAKAIKEGDHEAEYHLANILIDEGDRRNGERLLNRGVEAGFAASICRLGELRLKVEKKEDEALRLLKAAVAKESIDAMLLLGAYYAEKTGLFGGCRDKDLAIKYYAMAARRGNEQAKAALVDLKGK